MFILDVICKDQNLDSGTNTIKSHDGSWTKVVKSQPPPWPGWSAASAKHHQTWQASHPASPGDKEIEQQWQFPESTNKSKWWHWQCFSSFTSNSVIGLAWKYGRDRQTESHQAKNSYKILYTSRKSDRQIQFWSIWNVWILHFKLQVSLLLGTLTRNIFSRILNQ